MGRCIPYTGSRPRSLQVHSCILPGWMFCRVKLSMSKSGRIENLRAEISRRRDVDAGPVRLVISRGAICEVLRELLGVEQVGITEYPQPCAVLAPVVCPAGQACPTCRGPDCLVCGNVRAHCSCQAPQLRAAASGADTPFLREVAAAHTFLMGELAGGVRVDAQDLIARGKQRGLSRQAIRTARMNLDVLSARTEGNRRVWFIQRAR